MSWVKMGGTVRDVVTLLRTAHNLKLMTCLVLELSISYFQTMVNGG